MSVLRFFATMIIFACVSVAWMILGATMSYRTSNLDEKLSKEMDNLWGPAVLSQPWPCLQEDGASPRELALASNDIKASITHQTRNRGLLWFNTFTVDFQAKYGTPALVPEDAAKHQGSFTFPLPAYATRFDTLAVLLDDKPVAVRPADMSAGKISLALDLATAHSIDVSYKTHGRDMWLYAPVQMNKDKRRRDDYEALPIDGSTTSSPPSGCAAMSQLNKFSLTITTDFDDIDYPTGTSSPTIPAQKADGGKSANWTYTSAMTRQAMGVVVPRPVNAGPVAARMSYFAPVSLFFFFTVLFMVVVLKKVQLHPMHYLFIAAGFFAFHILMAYLVDLVDIQAAFWVCAAVSVLLVVSYMRLVAGARFALLYVAAAQLVYLIGFSYAFFTPGRTGLMITIGAILTLFVLMQATSKTNWFDILKPKPKFGPLPPMYAPAPPAAAATALGALSGGGQSPPPIPESSRSPWAPPPESGSSPLDGPEGSKR
jgi:hypothetical protein